MTIYIATLLIMAGIDSIWLMVIAKKFYQSKLGYIFAEKPNLTPAIIFYLLYTAGLMFFVIQPALRESWSLVRTFFTGGFLGLLAYAAYDLTNHATINNWPASVTYVDMAWGALLSALVSTIVYSIFK
ncbi:MAG: DUF2177 family protein [Patescibacteria group bacterium]